MSVNDWLPVVAVFAAYFLAVFAPFLFAVGLAWRANPRLDRRVTFVCVATAMAYGAVLFGFILVAVPLRLFLVYVYPSLAVTGLASRASEHSWILPLYRIGEPHEYVLPVALLAFGCFVVFSVWRRWPAISKALA